MWTPVTIATAAAAASAAASAAPPAPTPSPPAASAISAAVTPAVPASIMTLPLRAIVSNAWRIIPCGVVIRRKILRRRCIRFRLPFVHLVALAGAFSSPEVLAALFRRCVSFFVPCVLFAVLVLFVRLVQRDRLFMNRPRGEQFSRQRFDQSVVLAARNRGRWRVPVAVPVVIVFEILEDVAHVEKRVPVQADVHESGLHARQNARHFSFVDAADERELFFALNVDFD